jgi:hypothetical protein
MKEQRLLDLFAQNPNMRGIRVVTSSINFEKLFGGSIGYFFKTLKNSLQSVNGVSNRQFFKNLSGAYFSLDNSKEFEIILIYDEKLSNLPETQVKIRLKKLLGHDIKIQFGTFLEFSARIKEMLGIVRKSQVFGDFYDKKY